MRTTIAIDDDVLDAAKDLARHQGRSLGEVMSDLARRSLQRPVARSERNGIPLLPITNPNARVTTEIINQLRDESP